MSLLLDFLDDYMKQRYLHKVRFYDTLVMGYAVAGKPQVALQMFGRMRFEGLDLDPFAYHVLLNSLVEESCFDAFHVILNQILLRGFQTDFTNAIVVRSFCKQKLFHDAELYLRGLLTQGRELHGHVVTVLVDALCKTKQFQKAGKLVQEFRDSGLVPMEDAYGVWIRDLVQAGQLDGALDFLRTKKSLEGYVPDVFRYNVLICSLLRENRLEELCDLLMEMKEGQISPDVVTMNAAFMAYKYLINTLCGDGSIDEAYRVLKNSIEQGYFPRGRTFSILADAFCREEKPDKMKELVIVALERNFMPTTFSYDKFISALCRARRVEIGGDIAARLLIEMQAKGHTPTRALFRAVICCLCDMEYPENQFFKLLEMQLSRHEPNFHIYNFFIDGAGHAKKPDLAREVFEMMRRSGIEPTLSSDILMLQSYLKSKRISNALNFFSDIRQRRKINSKLYNTIIVGLCKVNKVDIALEFLRESRNNGVVPGTVCYEVLIQMLCSNKRYGMVINLINDLEKTGHHVTSFIGNILLLHSLKARELYDTWVNLKGVQNDKSSDSSLLGLLIGAFSGHVRVTQHVKDLEEVIEECFPLDIYTYNILLRRLSMSKMDLACELFNRMCQRGKAEARRWAEEMFQKGFDLTEHTQLYI
uniref:Pentatricopeptide repeat-containing protein n=1 Tax=Quercus lobata TaxID=97700 RepID=A0A7N2L514_QUELO